MAYIGQGIKEGTFSVLDTSGNTYNGSNVTFSLGTQVGSPAQLLVSHDGVIQKPGTDYSLATGGTQITFSTAPASGASIFIVEISGAVGGPLDSDLNGTELILDADGDTSITADTDDQIDFKIAGADDLRMTANAINVLSGTTLTIDSGATIANSGTATGFGTAADDITTGDGAVSLATSSGNITIDAQAGDSDIIFKGTDSSTDITALTIDMSDGGILQTRAGIGFPATQIASSGGNVLDDYEEGVFTGGFTFGGSATGIAYNRTVGIYTKIGDLVFVQGYVSLTSKGSQTGNAALTGLPFTSSSATNASSACGNMRVAQLSFANDTHLSISIQSGGVILDLCDTASGAGATFMTNDNFADNTGIEFGFAYTV
jgi:hypothetical protein